MNEYLPVGTAATTVALDELIQAFFFPQNLVSLYFAIIISGQFYWGNNIERKWNPFSPRFISDSAVSYSRSFPTYIFFIFTSLARVTHRIKLCWTSNLDCIDDSDSNQETSWESVKVLIVKASHLFKYAVSHSSLNYQCISTDSFHLRLSLLRTLSVSKKKITHHFKMLFLLFALAHRPFYAVCTCCLATCTKCHIWILYGDVHCMLMLWAKHTSP